MKTSVYKWNMVRPERFELPTLWFEGSTSGIGMIVFSRLGRLVRPLSVQFGLIRARLCKALCKESRAEFGGGLARITPPWADTRIRKTQSVR